MPFKQIFNVISGIWVSFFAIIPLQKILLHGKVHRSFKDSSQLINGGSQIIVLYWSPVYLSRYWKIRDCIIKTWFSILRNRNDNELMAQKTRMIQNLIKGYHLSNKFILQFVIQLKRCDKNIQYM